MRYINNWLYEPQGEFAPGQSTLPLPAGAVTLPAIEIDQGNKTYVFEHHAYASHCPVTGQTARDSEPVCYA